MTSKKGRTPVKYSDYGFDCAEQESMMPSHWKQRFGTDLPDDYWHPRDFQEKFLNNIPRSEWSKYRCSKPANLGEDGGLLDLTLGILLLGGVLIDFLSSSSD